MAALSKVELAKLYTLNQRSAREIADLFRCSMHKVNYWLAVYGIKKRTISEAIYAQRNPDGDPFLWHEPNTVKAAKLWGMGMGLYWGEGTKADTHAVRLGNTDPNLIRIFIKFLIECCEIDEKKLRFGLQVFSDTDPTGVLAFWVKTLKVSKDRFFKITITQSGKIGTYRHKNTTGVLTIYFGNKKLRDLLNAKLARVAQW